MPNTFLFDGFSKDGCIDFAISLADEGYIADVFDARIDNADDAYLTTLSFDSLADAIHELHRVGLFDELSKQRGG